MYYFLILTFFLWRIFLFLVAWFGSRLLSFQPSFPYSDIYLIPSGLPQWIWSFANFDGVHYLTIARNGYWAQFTQVFFPLYPLFINLINILLPLLNPLIIGLLISNIFFFLSLIIFWKLLKLDYKEKEIKWVITFLLFFPTSFFFGSLYTESLFMFLVLSSFYAVRTKRWWISGILGGLASGTRLVGILLLPVLLWEWHKGKIKNTIQNSKLSKYYLRFLHFAFCILHSPILYLVPLGLLSYMLYLQTTFGDALYFWHAQPVFGAERSGGGIILLPQVIWRYLKILSTVSFNTNSFWVALNEFIFTILAIFLLVLGHLRKVRFSYLLYSWLVIITPTLSGTLSSMPRYVLVAFPIFILLGTIKNKIIKGWLFVICLLFFAIFTIIFTQGRWIS